MIIDKEIDKYYVYIYLDPRKPGKYIYGDYELDHEPFYVGKGKGSRYVSHLKINNDHNLLKINKIQKIMNIGYNPIILKLHENISNKDSLILEKNIIDIIGRVIKNDGPLLNIKDGGEPTFGHETSEKNIERLYHPVVKYDIDGNILEEYISVKEAGYKNKMFAQTVSSICNGDIKIYDDKYIFLYKEDIFKKRYRGKKMFPVIKTDYNNNKTEYESITQAANINSLNLSKINAVCMGDRFQHGGYIWRYKSHPKLNKFMYKINNSYTKYLSILDKKIIYNNETIYNNILHVISENENLKVNNLLTLISLNKKYSFYEF